MVLREAYIEKIDTKINARFYEKGTYSILNPRMIIDEHHIPKIEHLFHRMKDANLFCHLDITDAYTHLPIDKDFRQALTLNTPTHRLIRPIRAVYGATNIPVIWQLRMEMVFQDLSNVVNFFDDILIFAWIR